MPSSFINIENTFLPSTPLLELQDLYFKDFDSHAESYHSGANIINYPNQEFASTSRVPADEFDIPYDHTHIADIDHLTRENPLKIANPDSHRPTSPIRGRTRQREAYSEHVTYLPPSPDRSERSSCLPPPIPKHPRLPSRNMSRNTEPSSSGSSVFDEPTYEDHYTDPTEQSRGASSDDAPGSYDLKAPPPGNILENIEYLSERLFSADHIKYILRDPALANRFISFLTRYRPESRHYVEQYTNVQKAISAVQYANAIAESLGGPGATAAQPDEDFALITKRSVEDLVENALPGYITHRLVQIVTEVLVKEITGQNTPIMRELVNGLAEVYCLTDPALPDNPIVYASEEFYRCTQYGKNYVIGRNCRFLQGPKSSNASVQRLVDALSEGQEICETILNYRRDGSPFMNLLMIAPLYDNKGAVRYFIGAQIDVNGLIERGRGLDSFERLLKDERKNEKFGGRNPEKSPEEALNELATLMDEDDLHSITSGTGRHGTKTKGSVGGGSGESTPVKPQRRQGATTRRFIGMDDPTDKGLWPAPSLGPSGRLPGVFQNYLLIRPYPSLRITFTSPALRIPGLLQSKFLDRIGGAARIRDQILDALSSGVGVTAKVTWLPNVSPSSQTDKDRDNVGGQYRENDSGGQQRWIHATPLLGSDDKVGVWMVVMVENATVTSAVGRAQPDTKSITSNAAPSETSQSQTTKRPNPNAGKYYQEYLRRDAQSRPQQPADHHRDAIAHESDGKDSIQRAALAKSQPQNQPQSQPQSQSSYQPQFHTQSAQAQPQRQSQPPSTIQQPPNTRRPSNNPSAASDVPLPYRPGYGSPKVFPGELKPVTGAYGGLHPSGAHEKVGAERMPGGGTGLGKDKEAMARRLAERATAGEDSFRDF